MEPVYRDTIFHMLASEQAAFFLKGPGFVLQALWRCVGFLLLVVQKAEE